jgi:hypothetical protein
MPVVSVRDRPRRRRLPWRVMTMADARVLGTSLAVLTAAFWTYYLWDMGTAAGAAWGSLLQVVFGTWLGGRDGESATASDVRQAALDRAADRVLASDADTRDRLAAEIRGLGPPA